MTKRMVSNINGISRNVFANPDDSEQNKTRTGVFRMMANLPSDPPPRSPSGSPIRLCREGLGVECFVRFLLAGQELEGYIYSDSRRNSVIFVD